MLENARRISEDYNLLFVTHASESRVEVETIQQRFGKTPIEYLHEVGLLGPRTLLAHCVHLRDDEIQLLKETGASVAHCPESNLKLANGVARLPDLLRAGVNVAIGTDGAATNNDLDMLGEMFTAAMIHKGVWGDPTCPKAEHVFELATVKAARAIGMAERLGSLEVGKLADIAILELDAPHLTPLYNVYSHLIYAANKNDVRSVFIHGKPVMLNRELQTLNEEEIKANVRRVAAQINSESGGQP
jgi:5-methylthioadenosine/S-adenosylhomocysteine deaminase